MTREELIARLNAQYTAGDPLRDAVLDLIQSEAEATVRADTAEADLRAQVSMAERGAQQYALLEAKLVEAERKLRELPLKEAEEVARAVAKAAAAEAREKALRKLAAPLACSWAGVTLQYLATPAGQAFMREMAEAADRLRPALDRKET